MSRREIFDGMFVDYPKGALDSDIDLDEHRFIAVEQDARPDKDEVFVTGYRTLPAACDYLATVVENGWWPLFILDLDTGERVEVDVVTKVLPKSLGAVVVPMSKEEAVRVVDALTTPERSATAAFAKRLAAAFRS